MFWKQIGLIDCWCAADECQGDKLDRCWRDKWWNSWWSDRRFWNQKFTKLVPKHGATEVNWLGLLTTSQTWSRSSIKWIRLCKQFRKLRNGISRPCVKVGWRQLFWDVAIQKGLVGTWTHDAGVARVRIERWFCVQQSIFHAKSWIDAVREPGSEATRPGSKAKHGAHWLDKVVQVQKERRWGLSFGRIKRSPILFSRWWLGLFPVLEL